MIRKTVLLILMFLLGSLSAMAQSASSGRYTLNAPPGWVVDTESGKSQGLQVVLYPKGTSWTNGNVVMYANTVAKSASRGDTAESVMNGDIDTFKKQSPQIEISPVRVVKTRNGQSALVREFAKSIGGNFEAVAYIEETQSVVILALSSRTKAVFEKALGSFDKLIEGYTFIEAARTETIAAIEEAVRRATLEKATADVQSAHGQDYNAAVGRAFGKTHEKMITECIKSTRAIEANSIDFVIMVGPKGRAADVVALEKNIMADCLRTKLQQMRWPRPPFSPFHAKVSLKLK